jgi:two-component system sensor histidine kinase/response regulator
MAVVITDTWGRIEYVNPAFARITGYSPEEVVGLNPRVLKSGAHPPEYYKAMWDVLMAGGVWRDEICNKKKSGELYWEYAEIAPVRDAAGCVTHYVAVKEDMTERRRVAEELRRAKEAAVAANGAKSLFLANMSHEIRTPMNAILGFSQLMRRDPSLNPGQKQNLDIVIRSGEHLMELINDILEISKIEAGRVTLNTAAFDLRDMLKTLDPMFRLRAEAKRLKFTVSVADGVPRRIAADEHKLKQVLINLLGNAVKFTQRGSVALAVRIEEDSKGGRRIVAEVTDTGPGISPEDMGLLFRTFEQTRVGREAATGTGLGLAISRQYAQLMGGDITVDSRVGEGSVFRFHMALHEGDPSGATAKTKTRRVTGLAVGRPALRVLVVEDEADEGRLLSRILSSTGFEVHLAAGGEDGVRDFEAWRPSLVLMDLIMSGTDGYEAIRRIRSGAGGKGVKILAVSASAFEESRRKAMAAGADDFVSKPFLDEELYEKIGSHLGVSCVYTEKVVSAGEEPGVRSELSPDAVAALPRDLVRDLRGAAFKGDFDLVVELIGRVEPIDVRLALGLRELAGRYDSPRLVDLLSEAPRAEPGESSAPRGGEGSRGKIT